MFLCSLTNVNWHTNSCTTFVYKLKSIYMWQKGQALFFVNEYQIDFKSLFYNVEGFIYSPTD